MDLVLRICDDYFLDKIWARLIPSTWSQIVSLPHSLHQNASLYPTIAKSNSLARMSAWPRDYIPRQLISLCVITLVGIHVLYFLFAWLSYKFIFNHEMMKHPRFLKNQVKLEIQTSLSAFPVMLLLTLPWFQAEVMGYSKVYDGLDTYGYFYLFASVPLRVFLSRFSHIIN
jgi:lathosterol oxidase